MVKPRWVQLFEDTNTAEHLPPDVASNLSFGPDEARNEEQGTLEWQFWNGMIIVTFDEIYTLDIECPGDYPEQPPLIKFNECFGRALTIPGINIETGEIPRTSQIFKNWSGEPLVEVMSRLRKSMMGDLF